MHVSDEYVPVLGRSMTVRRPDGPTRGGVVALHGATSPERDQPLFGHLADTLTPFGYAVASYDRRSHDGGGVPLHDQATDALAGLEYLRERIGAPVGLYGFSQGAWAASVAAARSADVAFLAVLGCSGVSTLLMYGEDEENVPAAPSIAVWRRASPADLTVETIARCGHFPSPDGGQRRSDIASAYGDVLAAWF